VLSFAVLLSHGYSFGSDRIENTSSNSSSIVGCIFIAEEVFIEPLTSNGRLFWLHYSAFPMPCHNIFEHPVVLIN
jgi:hypothetical protein